MRLCYDQKRSKGDPNGVKPMDTSHAEHYNEDKSGEILGNDESDLDALKGKGKGFEGQCFYCGQYGHRVAGCPKKDIVMIQVKGTNKGFGKGKNPPQQQMLNGKGKSDTETTGHGMIFGPTLGEVNQEYVLFRSSPRGSLETALLC